MALLLWPHRCIKACVSWEILPFCCCFFPSLRCLLCSSRDYVFSTLPPLEMNCCLHSFILSKLMNWGLNGCHKRSDPGHLSVGLGQRAWKIKIFRFRVPSQLRLEPEGPPADKQDWGGRFFISRLSIFFRPKACVAGNSPRMCHSTRDCCTVVAPKCRQSEYFAC